MTIREDRFSPVLFRIDPFAQSPLVLKSAISRTFFPSAQVDGASLSPFYAGLRVSTKKRSLAASLFACLLFDDDIDDSLRYDDDFHNGLAFGEFLDFRKSLGFFADFFARHSNRDGDCRADLAIDLDS